MYDCMYSWGLNNVGSLTTVCFFVLHGILLTSAIASMLGAHEQRGGSWASPSVLVNVSSQVPIFRLADSNSCRLFTRKSCFVLMSADCWEKHTVCLRVWGRAAAEPSFPPSPSRQSIHRDSAGARWKPLAMIYGMSSCRERAWGPLPPTLTSGWGETALWMKSIRCGPWQFRSTVWRELTRCTLNTWIWLKMWY